MGVSNQNEIVMYMHCRRCIDEVPAGKTPQEYQQIEVGWTKAGFQVWCKRHNSNILNIDFEGQRHKANTTFDDPGEQVAQ